jgi:hypothetical protein
VTKIRRIAILSRGKRFARQHLNRKLLGEVAHICHLRESWKCKVRGSWSRLALAKSEILSPNNQSKT